MPGKQRPSTVYFSDVAVESLDVRKTLPSKFKRMIRRFKLDDRIKDRTVGIKMHYGGNLGYTTIHPLFIRLLVDELKRMGAKRIAVMDNKVEDGVLRGYTREILGCEVVSTFGQTRKYLYREEIGFKGVDFAEFGGEAVDCDFFIDFSHVKGHGDCGFGGALKNIAMGVVPNTTRQKIHQLEGGITYDKDKCDLCQDCLNACPNDAILLNKKKQEIEIFFHHCTYCQHCVLVCPNEALQMEDRRFEDFSHGMALITDKFLRKFDPQDLLFINVLMNITMFCDCWGMSTPSLVPDIGILASRDIVAVESASLDLIKTENFLPHGLPKSRELLEGDGHLFERIHGKDPYLMVKFLEEVYGGSSRYDLQEVG